MKILSEDYEWQTYRTVKVNSTKIYAEKELETVLANLKDGTQVRILSTENNVCEIAYYDGTSWIRGYMRKSAIKNPAKTTVRNILIIIAVMASVCGTTTFFVLRKKVN